MNCSSISHTNSAQVLSDDEEYPGDSLFYWPGRSGLCFQNLTHQEQIGQQSAKMDGRVQIIDQLGTDDRLSEDQLDRSERVAGVAGDHLEERVVAVGRYKILLLHRDRETLRKSVRSCDNPPKILADFSAGCATNIAGEALRRVGQHKLITFFDCVAALLNISRHPLVSSRLVWTLTWMLRQASAPDRVLSDRSHGSSSRKSSIL